MASRLNPYLSFDGDAREALEFYRDVFGGELTVSTFGQFGGADPAVADKVMHGQLQTSAGYTIMAADLMPGMDHNPGTSFTVSLSGDDESELQKYWEALSQGGSVTHALEKQVWGDTFGMCVDRYGVPWMVNISVVST